MGSRRPAIVAAVLAASFVIPAPAAGQSGGGRGGGGGGGGGGTVDYGDLFGDLVHIMRDPTTGQPILQKRMIEYPMDVLDWGYCPIFVDVYGAEVPFTPLSCEVDAAFVDRLVEVDYFGRLSGARAGERNLRMHFDEVIVKIQEAEAVDRDGGGRLKMGTGCLPDGSCAEWTTVDAPFENLGFYHRLMKYGHIQTDPAEIDTSAHGDPEAGTVYHPALRAADWAKFRGPLTALLPRTSVTECFSGDTFNTACAAPTGLTTADFVRAASFLGGAAGKTGKITIDLVQYLNRILYITEDTEGSLATLNTLPALIRDENGTIAPAPDGLPAPADERFVDFSAAAYLREEQFSMTIAALVPAGEGLWQENYAVSLLPFLRFINGPSVPAVGLTAFVKTSSDALRSIEFIHNYAIPGDIAAGGAATTMTVPPATASFSAADQAVALQATITDEVAVNGGTVTFTVEAASGTVVGLPAVSGIVAGGVATAGYTLPGDTAPQVLTIKAAYSGAAGFAPAYAVSTLTITGTLPDPCVTSIEPTAATADPAGETLSLVITTSSACVWAAVSNAAWIVPASMSGFGSATLSYVVDPNTTGLTRSGTITVGTLVLTVTQASSTQPPGPVESTWGDFYVPLDGKADAALFDPSTGLWIFKDSATAGIATFGPFGDTATYHDLLVPADYTGDGITDCAAFRPSTGVWTIAPACGSTGQYSVTLGGDASDVPAPADFDGDGKTDIVIYRRATSTWYVSRSTGGATSTSTAVAAVSECTTPMPAEGWVCVNGGWVPPDHPLANSVPAPVTPDTVVIEWGWSWTLVVPVPADYDGDGKADFAYFAPFNASWWVLSSGTGAVSAFDWGTPGESVIPVPADYDGDGRIDLAYFYPENATWYILPSTTGVGQVTTFGAEQMTPVPADYDGDGKTDIALYQDGATSGTNVLWVLYSSTNSPGLIDMSSVSPLAVPVLRKPQ
jgi:hypothetical protein